MSRRVRRVPLDFEWPLNRVWEGYLLPENLRVLPCPLAGTECVDGVTRARAWVQEIGSLLLMLDSDLIAQARNQPMHPYFSTVPGFPDGPYGHHAHAFRPSADIHEFGTGLAGRESSWMGHDAIDTFYATAKLIKAAGLKKKWGYCPTCNARAYIEAYPGQDADAAAWAPTDPPAGDGWQMWETVSEGSPISPAFATPEELATWMLSHPHLGANLSFDQALQFVTEVGSSFGSFVSIGGEFLDGTSAALRVASESPSY